MSSSHGFLKPARGSGPLSTLVNRHLKSREARRAKLWSELLDGFHLKNTVTTSVEGRRAVIDGKEVINFSSANYLGLEQHPHIMKCAREALGEWGNHSGCSRIFSTHENLLRLESQLASLVGAEAAMVYPNTSSTHVGVIPTLFSSHEAVLFLDRYAHTSMYQASQMAVAKGARLERVDVRDLVEVHAKLRQYSHRVKALLIDGVYSMQGTIPDLEALQEICRQEGTILYIDDAHGIGIYGENGGGVVEEKRLSFESMILTGGLQKGLGAYGGFVAGSQALIDYLRVTSKSYIFSGTLQPQAVEGALAAIEICRSDEGKELRARLRSISRRVRGELLSMGYCLHDGGEQGDSPIVSVLVGPELKTIMAGRKLFDEGVYINSVLYPATPKGEGLLRISLNAIHSDDEITSLLRAFASLRSYLQNYTRPLGPNIDYVREFAQRQYSRRLGWVSDRLVKNFGGL